MARIAGVNIPTNKRVNIALQYIHGIGPKFAREIVTKVALPMIVALTSYRMLKSFRSAKQSMLTTRSKAICVVKFR